MLWFLLKLNRTVVLVNMWNNPSLSGEEINGHVDDLNSSADRQL